MVTGAFYAIPGACECPLGQARRGCIVVYDQEPEGFWCLDRLGCGLLGIVHQICSLSLHVL